MRMFLAKGYSHFNKKPAEDLIREMMMTLDEESELFVKKEIMAFNFENGVLNLGWGDRFLCCTAFHSLIDIVSKLLNTYFAGQNF
ncbi:unnamed protein product [Rhizophagus irregularis]|nr:unnamed protein product [Rhizophagus irregularis]